MVSQLKRLKAFEPYVDELRELLRRRRTDPAFDEMAERALNGEASSKLLALVSASGLKRNGIFFSDSVLAAKAAQRLNPCRSHQRLLIVDPACGGGDLLLGAAKELPVSRSLTNTLRNWGKQLAGFDLHQQFIDATHLRLALLAISRGAHYDLSPKLPLATLMPFIRKGNGLRELPSLRGVTHLLINPPFCPVLAPKKCLWATGKVTKAAVFFAHCVEILPAGTSITGILPDVLRSGSRYQHWREHIEQLATIVEVASAGKFKTAKVDVFFLRLEKDTQPRRGRGVYTWWPQTKAQETLGDHFDVHVGPVVPHRLKKREGPIYPFLHAKRLPFWGTFTPGAEKVAFRKQAAQPPFVVVRRTSSPKDRFRAIGTVIDGPSAVAVENHLIICTPKHGGIGKCKRLIKVLKRSATNDFLNARIRCRHLTVEVIKEIPW